MKVTTTPGTARGVTTLMYVGDVAGDTATPLTNRQLGAGALGLAAALFGGGAVVRAAGAGVVGYLFARSRGLT